MWTQRAIVALGWAFEFKLTFTSDQFLSGQKVGYVNLWAPLPPSHYNKFMLSLVLWGNISWILVSTLPLPSCVTLGFSFISCKVWLIIVLICVKHSECAWYTVRCGGSVGIGLNPWYKRDANPLNKDSHSLSIAWLRYGCLVRNYISQPPLQLGGVMWLLLANGTWAKVSSHFQA